MWYQEKLNLLINLNEKEKFQINVIDQVCTWILEENFPGKEKAYSYRHKKHTGY